MKGRCRYFAPEVIQSSAMDCGPASLKCLLEGFGVSVSYGRLREACQTDVDGTSIDTLEDVAVRLGLDAEQIMVPLDHVLLSEAAVLPALIVVRLPNGFTHFVVAWRRHGPLVQVMDPGTGRRWEAAARFLEEIYVHTNEVDAAGWREWAGGEEFQSALRARLVRLGIPRQRAQILLETALADPGWEALGALDAATRLTSSVVRAGAVRRGSEATRMLGRLFGEAREQADLARPAVPADYWSVRPAAGPGRLWLKGAVMISARGRAPARELTPELEAALKEPPRRPGLELIRLLRADGLFTPPALAGILAVAAGGTLLEAVLFRGLFDLGRDLGLAGQRLAAVAATAIFIAALLLVEFPLAAALLRLGRHLETRLRAAFLEKIPRLGDRYFQSRLKSDMAERSHTIHQIRHLPDLGSQLLRSMFELLLTLAGVIWLDPAAAPLAGAAVAISLLTPLLLQPLLAERDLRVHSHLGTLSRYYLDAFLGLAPLRAHGGEQSLRAEHQSVLGEWRRAAFALQRTAVGIEAVQLLTAFGLSVWLLMNHLARSGEGGAMLLLIYWVLNLPALGQEVAEVAWQYPTFRNSTLRLLEPLGALEEDTAPASVPLLQPVREAQLGMAIAMRGVTVRAGGHTILEDIDLSIDPGSHVAIVGPSGAGKSSLVGLLQGWHRPAAGAITIDERPLDGAALPGVRRQVAWIDPTVHLWNRPLAENLTYGTADAHAGLGVAIDGADLREVLEAVPDGLQTRLGEGGALLSGGQGQRVRAGRALLRPGVRLAILDEPFRGLDREKRRVLLARAREFWKDATLLCITHDVGETLVFRRVLVIENGRVVEDGDPRQLAARAGSRYRTLLDAEADVLENLWGDPAWRHLQLSSGVVREEQKRRAAWPAIS
jgi:ABC-type bacteriocin/lantibiotic exporter with double-glycine peptidase domain